MKRLRILAFSAVFILVVGSLYYYSRAEQNEKENTFYGKWEIVRCAAKTFISNWDNEDEIIESSLSEIYIYSEQSMENITSDGYVTTIKNPYYKLTLITLEELSGYRIPVKDLELNSNIITKVKVYLDKDFKKKCEYVGSTFFIKDKDTLLLLTNGAFFEMKRVK